MPSIVLDTETTGLVASKSRITEIAVVRWEDGEVLLRTYLDPQCPIPEEITKITGITDETVRGQPLFASIAQGLRVLIESAEAAIGYNPSFDRGMIDAEYERLGQPLPVWPILIDPRRLWDVYEPREERRLQNAFKRFVDRGGFAGWHGALADTNATRDVLKAQIDIFGLNDVKWDEMDPERKNWWGPSAHILWEANDHTVSGQSGSRRLVVNFGKNRGVPVVEVDAGFWRWVKDRDFDDHVLMLAIKLIDFSATPHLITPWAEEHARVMKW